MEPALEIEGLVGADDEARPGPGNGEGLLPRKGGGDVRWAPACGEDARLQDGLIDPGIRRREGYAGAAEEGGAGGAPGRQDDIRRSHGTTSTEGRKA